MGVDRRVLLAFPILLNQEVNHATFNAVVGLVDELRAPGCEVQTHQTAFHQLFVGS